MRFRVIAAVGLAAALLSLTACRNSPAVAAYVGDTQITESQVTEVTDAYNKAVREFNAQQQGQQPVSEVSREIALSVLLRDELCTRLSKEKGFTFSVDSSQGATTQLENIAAHAGACVRAMPAPEQKPTEEQYRALYDRLVAQGQVQPGSYDQLKQQIQSDPNLVATLSKEQVLADAAHITLNPRYQQVSILGFNPLNPSESLAVVDRPATQAPQ